MLELVLSLRTCEPPRCPLSVRPSLTMPCPPRPEPATPALAPHLSACSDLIGISWAHLSFPPAQGFPDPLLARAEADLHAPAPCRCNAETEAANEGAHLATHISDLDMPACSAPLPRHLCNPGGTSGISAGKGKDQPFSIPGAVPAGCPIPLPPSREAAPAPFGALCLAALPDPIAGGLQRGAATPQQPRGRASQALLLPTSLLRSGK